MLKRHIAAIDNNLSMLQNSTQLSTLVSKLLDKKVFSPPMIARILDPSNRIEQQITDLYLEVQKRGPDAFELLIESLMESGHNMLAQRLQNDGREALTDKELAIPIPRPNSFYNDFPSQIPHIPPHRPEFVGNPLAELGGGVSEDNMSTSSSPSAHHSCGIHQTQVTALPQYLENSYAKTGLTGALQNMDLQPGDTVNISEQEQSVVVVQSKIRLDLVEDKIPKYKMGSKPRGYLLCINNIHFNDCEDFPIRHGADRDDKRLISLFQQLGFLVEHYRDKTKPEMVRIVESFSKKAEFKNVDCVCVCFMSHGTDGSSLDDTEIIGIDSLGYRTADILACFYHNNCPHLMNKPKLFFFQSCRGNLLDNGVSVGHHLQDHHEPPRHSRVATDGRVNKRGVVVRDRTYSDIFMAYPVVPGHLANRDTKLGAWFIQAIVDVFAEHACDRDLESLFKLVDLKIKQMRTVCETNFQTLETRLLGFSKRLFFNPGLYEGMESKELNSREEGMDVVDTFEAKENNDKENCEKNTKCKKKVDTYSRLDDSPTADSCFNCFNIKDKCTQC